MEGNKQSQWSVTLSLLIVIIGLFLVCAQRRGMVAGGEGDAANDDQFKQELLQLLELADDSNSGQESVASGDQPSSSTEQISDTSIAPINQDDVVSMLMNEEEKGGEAPVTQTRSDNLGLSPEMFEQIRVDVERLEKNLERKKMLVDSIRRVVDQRNAHLQELESRALAQRQSPAPGRRRAVAGGESVPVGFLADYQTSRNHFERHRYQDAIGSFQKLLSDYPNQKMADNCQYWIGECYFGLKQYQQAVVEFQKVFAYSETDKHDDAQLMIGLSHVRNGQTDKAQKAFEEFLNNYGTSEYASVAKRYYRNI